MPVIVVANKIDMDPSRATRTFQFIQKHIESRGGNPEDFPLYFVSASDGSNVVTIFQEAIKKAAQYKIDVQQGKSENFIDEVMEFIKDEKKRADGGIFKNDLPSPPLETESKDGIQSNIFS
jgi:predicted GTPase